MAMVLFFLASPTFAAPQFGRVKMHVLPEELPASVVDGSSTVIRNPEEWTVTPSATAGAPVAAVIVTSVSTTDASLSVPVASSTIVSSEAIVTATPAAEAISAKSTNGGITTQHTSITIGLLSASTVLFVLVA
ncbi:hypothetical protein HWV62_10881 [Athelia sp. TMB]|nr:hypothetical protein HWV62_10881 [Athelia sp. TMB]